MPMKYLQDLPLVSEHLRTFCDTDDIGVRGVDICNMYISNTYNIADTLSANLLLGIAVYVKAPGSLATCYAMFTAMSRRLKIYG